jgi:hypothetical protein
MVQLVCRSPLTRSRKPLRTDTGQGRKLAGDAATAFPAVPPPCSILLHRFSLRDVRIFRLPSGRFLSKAVSPMSYVVISAADRVRLDQLKDALDHLMFADMIATAAT